MTTSYNADGSAYLVDEYNTARTATVAGPRNSAAQLSAIAAFYAAQVVPAPDPSTPATIGQIPVMATAAPPSVADAGTAGAPTTEYAGKGHTHASKARKEIKACNAASFTWTYPVAFANGVVPICNGIAQTAAGVTDLVNVQIDGVPTNTSCTFKITRYSQGVIALVAGVLAVNSTPLAINLHLSALEP